MDPESHALEGTAMPSTCPIRIGRSRPCSSTPSSSSSSSELPSPLRERVLGAFSCHMMTLFSPVHSASASPPGSASASGLTASSSAPPRAPRADGRHSALLTALLVRTTHATRGRAAVYVSAGDERTNRTMARSEPSPGEADCTSRCFPEGLKASSEEMPSSLAPGKAACSRGAVRVLLPVAALCAEALLVDEEECASWDAGTNSESKETMLPLPLSAGPASHPAGSRCVGCASHASAVYPLRSSAAEAR